MTLKILLVAFTADNAFLHVLGLLGLLFECNEPRVTLCAAGGLEFLVVVTVLELELCLALLGDSGNVGLGEWSAGRY